MRGPVFVRRDSREVAPESLARAHALGEPAQQVKARPIVDADSQVQRRRGQRLRDVPPAAGYVEHVSVFERRAPNRLARRASGLLNVTHERRAPRLAVHAPTLAPRDLKDENVVVVPMQVEAARGLPTRVHVHLHVLSKQKLKPDRQLLHGFAQLVDGVEHERRALAQVPRQLRRLYARNRYLLTAARNVSQVRSDGQRLSVAHESEAREAEPVPSKYLAQTRPRHEVTEAPRRAAHVQDVHAPRGVEELLRGDGREYPRERVEARAARACNARVCGWPLRARGRAVTRRARVRASGLC